MTEFISQFMSNIFQDNVILATIIIACFPLIELKGAIPFAMSADFWGTNALSAWDAFLFAFIGNVVITIILALIFKPIYNLIKDKKFFKSILNFLTETASKKSKEIEEENKETNKSKKLWIKILSTFLFVAIPIPGTGVYTGTVLGILLGLNFWQTISSVTLGNLVAGIIIMTICSVFPSFTNILFYIFIIIILIFLAYKIIIHIINKKSAQIEENEETTANNALNNESNNENTQISAENNKNSKTKNISEDKK